MIFFCPNSHIYVAFICMQARQFQQTVQIRDEKGRVKNTMIRTALIVWRSEEIGVCRTASEARLSFTCCPPDIDLLPGDGASGWIDRE